MPACFFLLFLAAVFNGQTRDWVRQNPSPVGASVALYDIERVSAETLFVAGEYGELGKTTDGGATWSALHSGTTGSLFSASFLNSRTGWVAGAAGFIAATDDDGMTWQKQASGTQRSLMAIQFIDSNIGVAAGDSGTFLKTQDGGNLWLPLASPLAGEIDAVFFLGKDTGWIAGANGIARTTDGGGQWTLQQPTQSFRSIYFINSDTGWALHYFGALYRTFNGGANWQYESGLDGLLFHGYGIEFMDGQNGLAAGSYQASGTNFDGKIFRTRDGGVTWQQWGQFQQVLFDVAFIDTGAAWCAGDNGSLFYTSNGGSAWSSGVQGATGPLYGVFFADTNVGCAVGGSNFDSSIVLLTHNGGLTWTQRPTPIRNKRLKTVFFTDPSKGWIAGDDGTLMKSADSGRTWATATGGGAYDFNRLFFSDSLNGWAVSGNTFSSGAALRTRDGGLSWQTVTTPGNFDLEGVFFWDTLKGFIVGWAGTPAAGNILKTVDGGKTWSQVGDSSFGRLMDVHFVNAARGFISGTNKILATRDSGASWQVFHEEPLYLSHSCFTDTATGYAVAYSNTTPFPGYILKTIDGGFNWQREPVNQGGMFQAGGVHFANQNMGWVVSNGGTILKTASGGGVKWSIPNVTLLSPNGGQILAMDSVIQVSWAASDSSGIAGVTFWISIDKGKTFKMIDSASGNAGTWNWTVRADTASALCLLEIRARDGEGYTGKDRSDAVFSITGTSNGIQTPKNPKAPATLIAFTSNPVKSPGKVFLTLPPALDRKLIQLSIYDVKGRLVQSLLQGRAKPGVHALLFKNGRSTGVHLCVLKVDGKLRETKKWVATK